jgi:GDP-L-fucose synthase
MIAKEVGFSGRIVWDTTKPNGQPRRCLDVTRAQQYFGFRAQCSLREGIAKTVAWFVTHRSQYREAAVN